MILTRPQVSMGIPQSVSMPVFGDHTDDTQRGNEDRITRKFQLDVVDVSATTLYLIWTETSFCIQVLRQGGESMLRSPNM